MGDTTFVATQSIKEFQNVTSSVGLKDLLGLFSLFSSALVAVLVGQKLQDRKAKKDREYQNKFNIFATILGLRHAKGDNENFVIAINQIPIVFHKNKEIITKLNKFIANHVISGDNKEKQLENLNLDLNDLVLEMAKDLDYSNVDNDLMKSFYSPDSSYFRNQADAIYNELYCREKQIALDDARLKMK